MQLATLYVSQRGLRRPEQIPALVEAIQNGDPIPPIRLSVDDDGSIQVEDGHHRATAFWLAGRDKLSPQDYLLFPVSDLPRHRLGTLQDFVLRNTSSANLLKTELPYDNSP